MLVFDIRALLYQRAAKNTKGNWALVRVHDFMRARVPALEHHRSPSLDLDAIAELIASGDLERACTLNVN